MRMKVENDKRVILRQLALEFFFGYHLSHTSFILARLVSPCSVPSLVDVVEKMRSIMAYLMML